VGATVDVKVPLKATELPAANVEFALNVARLAALLELEPLPLPDPLWVTQYVVGGGIIAVEEPLLSRGSNPIPPNATVRTRAIKSILLCITLPP
jgi:hypothetical protein